MNLGLFASDVVGLEIARIIARRGDKPACLVLDERDSGGCNDRIRAATDVPAGDVLENGRLLESKTLARLKDMSLDLVILAWWPSILPQALIDVARIGCLNLHPSLLPYNRGKDPNFWALAEESPYGVTIHFIDDQIDSGEIAFQAELDVSWEDNAATLYHRARTRLVNLFDENYERIRRGDIPRRAQGPAPGPTRSRREISGASRIDLDTPCSPRALLNRLRARTFEPFPACWFEEGGERYEVRVSIERAPQPDATRPAAGREAGTSSPSVVQSNASG